MHKTVRKIVTSGPSAPASAQPDSIANLKLWWRRGAGLTAPGNVVSAWQDQITGIIVQQATALNRPTLDTDGVILFDGVNSILETTDASFTGLTKPCTIFWMGKMIQGEEIVAGGPLIQFAWHDITRFYIVRNQGSGIRNFDVDIWDGGNDVQALNVGVNKYLAVATVFNGASSSVRVKDSTGTLVGSATGDPGTEGDSAGVLMGAFFNFGSISAPNHMKTSDVFAYNAALSVANQDLLLQYLINRMTGLV